MSARVGLTSLAVGAVLLGAGFGPSSFALAQGTGVALPPPSATVVSVAAAPGVEVADARAIVPSALNSQRVGAQPAGLPDLSALRAEGYWIQPVASLDVLNSAAAVSPDASLRRVSGFDVVTSGTFYYAAGGALHPAGAVMRDGVLETSAPAKTAHRGGLAIREDGSVIIGQQQGNAAADIQGVFGYGSPVVDFMGGGALLIADGQKVDVRVLGGDATEGGQQFDQGGRAFASGQMRRTDHIVFAIRDGQLYVIGARGKGGQAIQDQLFAAGFTAAIKYDGGSGSYLRHGSSAVFSNSNPTGFGITLRR